MTTDNYYGFEDSNEIKLDAQGLPEGTYKARIAKEEEDIKDGVLRGFTVEWEVLEGEHKGKTAKTWYLTRHTNHQTANIALQNVKRIAEATGRSINQSSPLKGRVLTLVVGRGKDERYTEIKKYLPENYEVSPV